MRNCFEMFGRASLISVHHKTPSFLSLLPMGRYSFIPFPERGGATYGVKAAIGKKREKMSMPARPPVFIKDENNACLHKREGPGSVHCIPGLQTALKLQC